jgi:membrane-associated PAP2 superfamily phosphatase
MSVCLPSPSLLRCCGHACNGFQRFALFFGLIGQGEQYLFLVLFLVLFVFIR